MNEKLMELLARRMRVQHELVKCDAQRQCALGREADIVTFDHIPATGTRVVPGEER